MKVWPAFAVAILAALALICAAAAGAVIAGRLFTARPGDATDYRGGTAGKWRCAHLGRKVQCSSGDGFPFAELSVSSAGGLTVKVFTLKSGRFVRRSESGFPVYVFSAF